jgi:NAD(P)H-flavin reductase/hemoglobin-like flavoprotein
VDAARLKQNFAHVTRHGDEVGLFFYSRLFLDHPEFRDMFPVSMTAQRDRLVSALGRIVSDVDNLDRIRPFLEGLGRDHRKFGAVAGHFESLGVSLLATLAYFSGPDWTPGLEADWRAAYGLVAQIMIDAAAQDEQVHPAYWDATVLFHERRSVDTAVFRVTTLEELGYLPGQSVALECELRPRIWRFYSIANAPRADGTLDFHVRSIHGGELSMALVSGLSAGSRLRLGAPVGTLTLDTGSGRDVLLVAGSTGLAPVKAIAEQIAELAHPPRVHLFFGARRAEGLYDVADLEKFSASAPWLTVTPCVSDEGDYPGERGLLPDVVDRSGSWASCDAYLAGPSPMVESMAARLAAQGVPREQIHVEDFGWSEP